MQQDADFLYPVLNDAQLHSLLDLYDSINTWPAGRPFRFPPSDGCLRLKEAAAALKVNKSKSKQTAEK